MLFAGGAVESSGVRLLPAVLPCATIAGIATLTNTTLENDCFLFSEPPTYTKSL
jgi:hypothetical protein